MPDVQRIFIALSAFVLLCLAFENVNAKSLLKRDLPDEEVHPMIYRYAQKSNEQPYKPAVETLEALKRDNEALAARLLYLAKRQSNSTTTTTPPPPPPTTSSTTPAPPPVSSLTTAPSSTVPVTLYTTLPGGQRSTLTSYTVVPGPTGYVTPTGPARTSSTTTSIRLQNGVETAFRVPSAVAAILAVFAAMLAF